MAAARLVVVTCLDHRVDPAVGLGLRLGDAPVLRNAGGRVTQAVIDDIGEQLGQLAGVREPSRRRATVTDDHGVMIFCCAC